MELSPSTYYPKYYLQDLSRWNGYVSDIPERGQLGLICGRSAYKLIKAEEYREFSCFSHFLAVVYVLSKIDSVIGVFPSGWYAWRNNCPPHPVPFCPYCHGGVSDTSSMLRYFYEKIPDRRFLPSYDLLSEYARIFIPITVTMALNESPELDRRVVKESPLPEDDFKKALTAGLLPKEADERGIAIYQQLIDAREQRYQAVRNEVLRKEAERAAEGKARRAKKATGVLYNAVRRGDLKAVSALISKGADSTIRTPDGCSLIEFAKAQGRDDIVAALVVTNSAEA